MKRINLFFAILATMLLMNGLVFAQDTTLTVTGTGKVGIGTTDPRAPLHIKSRRNQPDLYLEEVDAGHAAQIFFENPQRVWELGGDAAPDIFFIHQTGQPQDDFVIDKDGNVGIGTATPGAKLEIAGNGTATGIQVNQPGASPGITVNGANPGIYIITGFSGATGLLAEVNSTTGIAVKGEALQKNGSTTGVLGLVNSPNGTAGVFQNTDTGGKILSAFSGTGVGTEVFSVSGNGNVGIGTTNPVHPLEMASGAHVTAGGVWTDASSRQYKENISNLTPEEAIAALEKLNPVKFNYKVQKDEEYVGFIAEDVPALVATKARKSLSPMDIVAVLTKVVQQQQKKIAELEARLNASQ